jgi:hypothetical protein
MIEMLRTNTVMASCEAYLRKSGLEKRIPLKKVSKITEKLTRSSKLVTFRANGESHEFIRMDSNTKMKIPSDKKGDVKDTKLMRRAKTILLTKIIASHQ